MKTHVWHCQPYELPAVRIMVPHHHSCSTADKNALLFQVHVNSSQQQNQAEIKVQTTQRTKETASRTSPWRRSETL